MPATTLDIVTPQLAETVLGGEVDSLTARADEVQLWDDDNVLATVILGAPATWEEAAAA